MTTRDMEIFVAAAEQKSMSAAAEKLIITQPSVSLVITGLEREYQVRLFDRVGRRLHLTPAGEGLLAYAKGILQLRTEMEGFLRDESSAPGVRVGATATVGECFIPGVISALRNELPEARCQVAVANTKIVEDKLLKSALDIGVVEGDVTSRELAVRPILRDELTAICSASHRFAGRSSISLAELVGEPLILREEGSGTRAKLEAVFREHGLSIEPAWSSYSFGAIREAVLRGLGVTVMSPLIVADELRSGRLWAASIEDANLSRTFDLVYRKNKIFSRSLKRFAELCEFAAAEDRASSLLRT